MNQSHHFESRGGNRMNNSNTFVPWTTNMVEDELVEVIKTKANIKKFKKGQIVFHQGEESDKYYLLLHGRIEISLHSNDGKKKTISIHEPRCFFGELVMDHQPRLTTATCLTDVTVALMNTSFSLGSELNDKKLYKALFYSTNFKLRTQVLQLSELVFNEVEDRVEKLLSGLCANFGHDNDKFVQVNLPLTHQLIADIVGSSRVRVSQILSDFSKQEKIQVKRNEITLRKVK